jgi:hypothetical protein
MSTETGSPGERIKALEHFSVMIEEGGGGHGKRVRAGGEGGDRSSAPKPDATVLRGRTPGGPVEKRRGGASGNRHETDDHGKFRKGGIEVDGAVARGARQRKARRLHLASIRSRRNERSG